MTRKIDSPAEIPLEVSGQGHDRGYEILSSDSRDEIVAAGARSGRRRPRLTSGRDQSLVRSSGNRRAAISPWHAPQRFVKRIRKSE